jgi:hypothetical protein
MDGFWEVAPLLIMFPIFYLMLKAILDYAAKKKLIEKGMVNENVKFLAGFEGGFLSSLKWGLVLMGIGAALVIARLAKYDIEEEGLFVFGLMFLLAGIGLLVHYFIAAQKSKEQESDKNKAAL